MRPSMLQPDARTRNRSRFAHKISHVRTQDPASMRTALLPHYVTLQSTREVMHRPNFEMGIYAEFAVA